MRNFFKYAKGPAYDQLATMTTKQMKVIAGSGNSHPAARVNAAVDPGRD